MNIAHKILAERAQETESTVRRLSDGLGRFGLGINSISPLSAVARLEYEAANGRGGPSV